MSFYAAGLLHTKTQFLLVRMSSPEWVSDKYNFIGGRVQNGESFQDAMARQFKRQTLVEVRDWRTLTVVTGPGFSVHFFARECLRLIEVPEKTPQGEKLEWFGLNRFYDGSVHELVVPDLKWLIPMALDSRYPSNAGVINVRELSWE